MHRSPEVPASVFFQLLAALQVCKKVHRQVGRVLKLAKCVEKIHNAEIGKR